jgi:dienelactone hydrolase
MPRIISCFTVSVYVGLLLRAAAVNAVQNPAPGQESSPLTVEYASGSLSLRGMMYRPAGNGPRPAILFLHGSSADYTKEMSTIGPLYARNGYVLFFPFRRGQGLSVGRGEPISEPLSREFKANGPAARMRLTAQLLATEQMDDVLAALKYLQTQPYVDATRIAVVGNSFGGILAVFSAERAPGIRAVVASAPAAQTWASAPELRERLLSAAKNAQVPIYFLQASNDFDLAPTEKLAEEMRLAGKPHTRKIFPAFGTSKPEGHSFGYFGGDIWGPDVFGFLSQMK